VNVLVTSVSRKVPLVAALRAAVEEAGGGAVWGADADPECVARYFTDRFWAMPRLSDPDAAGALRRFCAEQAIGLLVPTRDGELPFFAARREDFAAAGTYVPIGTPEAVGTCLDKLAFHAHCRAHGLPTAPTALALGELEGDAFVVKERHGAGGHGIAVGVDRAGAAAAAARLDAPVFQPLVAGVEHSVDVYVNRDGRVVDAAPRIRVRVHAGESNVTETVEHPALAGAAVALAESLPLRGHLVIQAFARGPDVTLIECNPRVGGASTLGFHAGVATPRWALEEAHGATVAPRRGAYRRGLRLVRYPADRVLAP
jgi:carbamoyl-phosphate synthase large subunit